MFDLEVKLEELPFLKLPEIKTTATITKIAVTIFKFPRDFNIKIKIIPNAKTADLSKDLKNKFMVDISAKKRGIKNAPICESVA